MKNGCKDFVSAAMDELGIDHYSENRLHDIQFARVRLSTLNHRGVPHFDATMKLMRELYEYIVYLYAHIAQLEKDKRYLLGQKLTLYSKQVGKDVVVNTKYVNYRCPRCNAVLGISQHYCCQCGQKLNWRGILH